MKRRNVRINKDVFIRAVDISKYSHAGLGKAFGRSSSYYYDVLKSGMMRACDAIHFCQICHVKKDDLICGEYSGDFSDRKHEIVDQGTRAFCPYCLNDMYPQRVLYDSKDGSKFVRGYRYYCDRCFVHSPEMNTLEQAFERTKVRCEYL